MQNQREEVSRLFKSIDSELDLLQVLGNHVVNETDIDTLLQRVVELACEVVDADSVILPLVDLDNEEYHYRAAYGKNADDILGTTLPLTVGMCGWVLRNEKPLLFGKGSPLKIDSTTHWERGTESVLLVPLIARGTIIGGLSALGKRGGDSFDDKDLKLLTIIASQASISIANAQYIQDLTQLASYDQLTRLVNRVEFEKRINNLIEARSTSNEHTDLLCFMDLDRFKLVNDSSGHTAGDELLRQISKLMVSRISENDTLARLGGDEFGLLLEDCPLDKAMQILQKIRQSVDDYHFTWGDNVYRVGLSIGAVVINHQYHDSGTLISAADQACMKAKHDGRNRVELYQADNPEYSLSGEDAARVALIQHALEQDRFELHYQPIVRLNDNEDGAYCYEILVRMRDEAGKLIMPSGFIDTAERFGLMQQIDKWVIEHYCEWLMNNPSQAEHMHKVSINLSATSIVDNRFHTFIKQCIKAYDIPFEKFCFEITETAAITNATRAYEFLQSMKDFGATFSLDDFGTGMCSFNYLKNIPAHVVKIDGSFIKDIQHDPVNQSLVKAMVEVAHTMDKVVVAEWVETAESLEILRGLDVDYVQGYYTGGVKPLSSLQDKVTGK